MNIDAMLLRTFAELDAAKCVPTVGLHLVGRQETNSCWLVWRAQRCIDLVGELTLRGDSNAFVVSLKNKVEALTSGGGDVAHIQIEQALFVGFKPENASFAVQKQRKSSCTMSES